MKHLENCDFEEIIKTAKKGYWSSGDGEISGSIEISNERIYFTDGWADYYPLPFLFCPCCGVKLRERTKEEGGE